MKKKLTIKKIKSEANGTITFMIDEQTHRNHTFGDDDMYWTDSTGFELSSSAYPQIGSTTLYVRGSSPTKDNLEIKVNLEQFNRILNAIREYNAYFNKREMKFGEDEYLTRMGIE